MAKALARAAVAMAVVLAALGAAARPAAADDIGPAPQDLDVPYEVTHPEVVEAMLRAGGISDKDIVYDLGCGDGRFLIMAAKKFGARGVGVDLDPQRIREARDIAAHEGLADRTEFRVEDIMVTDLRPATLIPFYMGEAFNTKVRPKFFRELAPGVAVVSHAFGMGDWEPDKVLRHPKARGGVFYLYHIPAPVGGTWRWTAKVGGKEVPVVLALEQQFQVLHGTLQVGGAAAVPLTTAAIAGKELTVGAPVVADGKALKLLCHGTVDGDAVQGLQQWEGKGDAESSPWAARRDAFDAAGRWDVTVPGHKEFSSTLTIFRKDGQPFARLGRDGKDQPLPDFYLWGTSVRFDIPGDKKPAVFTGGLTAEGGRGTLSKEGWSEDLTWRAKRVGEAPAVARSADPAPAAEAKPAAAPAATAATVTAESTEAAPAAAETIAPPPSRKWKPEMGQPQPGDEYTNLKDGSVLVWIPGGECTMGSDAGDNEKPPHKVKVEGFWLGKFEVTNRQYTEYMKQKPQEAEVPFLWDDPKFREPECPVVGVTWNAARAYCAWAGLARPTEVQWEYAAAAGRQLKYPTATGRIGRDLANTLGTGGKDKWDGPSPVGSFPPNPFGLYDMAGNAYEWTTSRFMPYPYSATDGRENPNVRGLRVLRGGGWYFPMDYCRTAYRHRFEGFLRYDYSGFRVMLPPIAAPK